MKIESELHKSGDEQTLTINLTLSREEFDELALAVGRVFATISPELMTQLSFDVLRLLNKINEDTPGFTPYWTPKAQVKP